MGVIFGFEAGEGFEPFNTTVRWTVVRHRLDGDDTMMKQIPLTPSKHPPNGWVLFLALKRERDLNHTIQQSGGLLLVACLDGDDTIMKQIPLTPPYNRQKGI